VSGGPAHAGGASSASWYCGGGLTDVGSTHQEHWSPLVGGGRRWCVGDPSLVPSPLADLQERVQRVLDWCADCGCTCEAEPGAPLRDHDSLCPGYVEHMLTARAEAGEPRG
jgi:hypothetical protein